MPAKYTASLLRNVIQSRRNSRPGGWNRVEGTGKAVGGASRSWILHRRLALNPTEFQIRISYPREQKEKHLAIMFWVSTVICI